MVYNPNDGRPDDASPDSTDALGMGKTLIHLFDPATGKDRALLPSDLTGATLSGTQVQRLAVPVSSLTQYTIWRETNPTPRTVAYTPGETIWRTFDGADADNTGRLT